MSFLKNIFLFHKSKIFLFVGLIAVFMVMFFPYDDLSDTITSQVATATNNTIYLQFEDLSVGFLPQPGIKMANVLFESPFASEIRVDTLKVAPSILALLQMKPLARIKASNLFRGELDLTTSGSSKIKAPQAISADLDFTNFDLNSLVKALVPFPMKANGKASLNAVVDLDLEMKSQPEGELQLTSPSVQIPAFNFESVTADAGGRPLKQAIAIPSIDMGRVQVKGKMKNGKLAFSDTVLGSAKDDIFARIGGDMDIRTTPAGVMPTYYNLQIDVTLKKSFLTSLGVYSSMLDLLIGKDKVKEVADGKRYMFRLQFNPNTDPMPNFAPY